MQNKNHASQRLITAVAILLTVFSSTSVAQSKNDLEAEVLAQDRQLFEIGFNQCDFDVWNRIFGKEFEFYDDRSGLNKKREREVRSFRERCKNAVDLKRRLIKSRVSPLGDDFALELGEHEFVINEEVVERAKFIHIWQLLDDEWIISRVVSYDHEAASSSQGND